MRTFNVAMTGLLATCLLGGCFITLTGGQAVPIQSTRDENFNALWDSAVEVLTQYRFKIDRADRRAGVITTYPLVGRHWFEFWRKDARTRGDVVEGALHNDNRQATVTIARVPSLSAGPHDYQLSVLVSTLRSNRQPEQVTSSSQAYEIFTGQIQTEEEDEEEEEEPTSGLTDIGRDKRLEGVLFTRIKLGAFHKLEKRSP